MKLQELYEGAQPTLPGAVPGIQVMTPQQFVAKSAEGEEPEPDEVDEELNRRGFLKGLGAAALGAAGTAKAAEPQYNMRPLTPGVERGHIEGVPALKYKDKIYKFAKGVEGPEQGEVLVVPAASIGIRGMHSVDVILGQDGLYYVHRPKDSVTIKENVRQYDYGKHFIIHALIPDTDGGKLKPYKANWKYGKDKEDAKKLWKLAIGDIPHKIVGIEEINITEATKLPAPTRPISDPELTDYLDRIRTQQKLKTDKYKLPYIHRSSVVGYYDEAGKKYNTEAIKTALGERPKSLLKKNEKMKHSDGELEQFFNIGFAALVGIALDQDTNDLIIVNTCPGAGSCKVDCFAMKGGKVQFQGPWLSDGRILTYLLNDPDGFFNQLKAEISKEEAKGKKGGYKVSIRWHDAGDFFSPEYAAMAFKLASELPGVDFYAYTKVSDVALGQKPKNFIINWSEGASSREEKKVKAADPHLERTKNSRIVPSNLFYDLLVKDEKKNLVKGPEGQWQVIPDKLPELKQRLAKEYGISANSILSYNEWETKTDSGKKETPIKYNVIITPGEPDITAKSHGVLSTLLLKH